MYTILQQFLAADTLNDYPKIHAALIAQDTIAGKLSIQLWDEYNSGGEIRSFPLTAWKVDGKIIFVFTGLETVAVGGDTTYHHLIRETALANEDKIWSPHFRCWRIDMQDQKIIRINKQVAFSSFNSLNRLAPPPPPPVLIHP
ncbi:hypothetical protein [Hymenobacter amundsenii]|uniref:hypothetical protein n=1 Tax=Hymenobacter amundsenii TaxID=2006685 RepID=UPI000F818099|nr:hypothetical protein [Hymenobacter amundsenii]